MPRLMVSERTVAPDKGALLTQANCCGQMITDARPIITAMMIIVFDFCANAIMSLQSEPH